MAPRLHYSAEHLEALEIDALRVVWRQTFRSPPPKAERAWIENSFTKVCVRVHSEEELIAIRDKAMEASLVVQLITDSGRTEFHGVATHTCLAIGPDYADLIDPITGELELY